MILRVVNTTIVRWIGGRGKQDNISSIGSPPIRFAKFPHSTQITHTSYKRCKHMVMRHQ